MSHVQWNPFRELSLLRAPGGLLFGPGAGLAERGRPEANWAPAVDVYETDEGALVVSAELPGVDAKEVQFFKRKCDHGLRRLRRIPIPPERFANPISQLGATVVRLDVHQRDGADSFTVERDSERDGFSVRELSRL